MLQSMTGYVSKAINFEVEGKPVLINISLKSLNSKHFEYNIKIPHVFYSVENDIVKILKSELKRGMIYLYINVSNIDVFKAGVKISYDSLDGYISAINQIKEKYNIQDNIRISDIIRLPDIFITEEKDLKEDQKNKFLILIKEATQELINQRLNEGSELEKDIILRIEKITHCIEEIGNEFELHFNEKQSEISKKIDTELVADENFADIQRKMFYTLLDKIDIHEEIIRFKSHIIKVKELLNASILEKGKSLDFTLQEMAREINTILAKTSSTKISHIGLSVKVELEKAREQAQNLV